MSNNSNRMIVFASILGAILATGLLALNPSTVTSAGAQMYGDHQYGYDRNYYYHDDNRYGYDNNHPEKKNVNVQKIKCVNSNINVNGVDITQIPEDSTATTAAANEGGTAEGANTQQNGNELADRINFEKNLVNICVNVNDNEQVKVTPPPEEATATLSVSKTVSCEPDGTTPGLQEICTAITTGLPPGAHITPDEFSITVSDTDPNPSQFDGSTTPVDVTLGPGNYQVTEAAKASVQQTITLLGTLFPTVNVVGPTATFSGDCAPNGQGTIAEGESQTCNIDNGFVVSLDDSG